MPEVDLQGTYITPEIQEILNSILEKEGSVVIKNVFFSRTVLDKKTRITIGGKDVD